MRIFVAMNRYLLIVAVICSLCFTLTSRSVCQNTTYFNLKTDLSLKHYADYCYSVVEDGNVYTTYSNTDDGAQYFSILLCGLNSSGSQQWLKEWGSDYPDKYAAQHGGLIKYNDSLWFSIYTASFYTGTSYNYHVYLQCHNSDLDTLWTKGFKEDTSLVATTLIRTLDGGLAIGSFRQDFLGFHIRKLSSAFETEWVKTVSFFDGNKYGTYNLTQTSDSGFAIAGTRFDTFVDGDPIVAKISSTGNLEWWLNFGGQYEDFGALVCTTNDGSLIVGNTLNLYEIDSYLWGRINISKMDNLGNVEWNRLYGNLGISNNINSIIGLADGGILACGDVSHDHFTQLGWMLRLNEEGDSVWYREYLYLTQPDELHYLFSAIPCSDNGFLACGSIFNSFTNPETDAWLLKVDSLGCVAEGDCWVGMTKDIVDQKINSGNSSILCTPNPALNTVNIKWTAEANALEVYTLQGVCIHSQQLERLSQFRLNTLNWLQGVYIVKIRTAAGDTNVGKFIKL